MVALKIQGLPYSASQDDISTFFSGYNLEPSSVKIGVYPDGKATGQAVALFSDAENAKGAQSELNKKYIGSRYVDLILISNDDH